MERIKMLQRPIRAKQEESENLREEANQLLKKEKPRDL